MPDFAFGTPTVQRFGRRKRGSAGGGAAGHAWWRILQEDAANPGYYAIAEFDFRGSAGGPSLLSGGTPIDGANRGAGFTVAEALDGNASTYWGIMKSSQTDPATHWLGYQFASPVVVAEVSITARDDPNNYNQAPRAFRVQWSDDGTTWTDALVVTAEPGWWVAETRTYAIP